LEVLERIEKCDHRQHDVRRQSIRACAPEQNRPETTRTSSYHLRSVKEMVDEEQHGGHLCVTNVVCSQVAIRTRRSVSHFPRPRDPNPVSINHVKEQAQDLTHSSVLAVPGSSDASRGNLTRAAVSY